jgi:hypothetical protein
LIDKKEDLNLMEWFYFYSSILFIISFHFSSAQFSVYDQTIIPFSIYNADGNPNNLITNSKSFKELFSFLSEQTKNIVSMMILFI